MRILDVSPRTVYPPENGSSVRIYHLLRHLSRRHEIRQFSQPRLAQFWNKPFAREVWVTPSYQEHRYTHPLPSLASEFCHRLWISQPVLIGAAMSVADPRRLREWLSWADLVLVEFPWQFAYCHRKNPRAPLVLSSHNVELPTRISNAQAAGITPESSYWLKQVRKLERFAVKQADLILAVSPEDRQVYISDYGVAPERVVEIPNGSDTEQFVPADPATKPAWKRKLGLPDKPTVVYMAAIPKVPDQVGLAWVRRLARQMPEFSFLVVGNVAARPEIDGNLIVKGWVEELAPYLHAADVSLCPIQYGGGTKIKVWDSLAAGLPTVVFAETLHGTALEHQQHVWVAEKTEQSLMAAVRRLVADPAFGGQLGASGRRFVVAHHDWRNIALRLETALLDFMKSRPE